jgi:hypothetical protein
MQYDLGMLGMGMNTLSVFWSKGMTKIYSGNALKDINLHSIFYFRCEEQITKVLMNLLKKKKTKVESKSKKGANGKCSFCCI